MPLTYNIPMFSILLVLMSAMVIPFFPKKSWGLNLIRGVEVVVAVLSAVLLVQLPESGESFTYQMGHFPAPWGNLLRCGPLEALLALVFSVVMILSLCAGAEDIRWDVRADRQGSYCVLMQLLFGALLAMIYTDDLFTAYVFVEINTISACGLIMIRQNGRTIEAAVRYMIMSLLGSGLLLVGISMLYDMTGHLLMSNIKETVGEIVAQGEFRMPLVVTIGLICVGLAIKSALFPFHSWLPDAYGYSTVSSAAMLSSLVSKGYIFLLIKIIYRVIGFDFIAENKIINVFFVFGLMGMIFGSLSAIKENDIRRMISFSSVAQIGYIYMGFGLGTEIGMVASIFHILSHAATKSLLFISAIGLTDVSKGSRKFQDLTGAAYRHKIAGIGFTVGSLSMVGMPMLSGFVSKLLFAQASIGHAYKMLPALIVLGISTVLNAIYFMKTVIRIFVPERRTDCEVITIGAEKTYTVTIVLFICLNIALGMLSQPIVKWIQSGLAMFG